MSIKVILADDEGIIRESLKILLSIDDDIDIVGTFDNGEAAYLYCASNEIDIALLDIRMPKCDGVMATKEINNQGNTKVIILTTFDEDEYIKKAIEYGARGYLLKNANPAEIINAIKAVYNGSSVMNTEILQKINENTYSLTISNGDLTEREKEIIFNIAEGLNNKQISKKLFIAEGTVKNYISSILDKCGLEHRTQIAIAYLKGEI